MNRRPHNDHPEERTNPGAAIDDPADDASGEGEDEFPNEATRIDQTYMNKPATPARPPSANTLEALAAQRAGKRSVSTSSTPAADRAQTAPGADSRSKLAALQSLSLDAPQSTSSTRLPPTPRAQGSSKLPWILLVLVLGAVGGKWYWDRTRGPGGEHGTAAAVHTERATIRGGAGQTHVAAGFTAAATTIPVGTPSGGSIKSVSVQNGDKIKRGQIIVMLDSSGAQAELSAAAAQVREAERSLSNYTMLFKAGAATPIQVSQARGLVDVERAKLRPIEQRIDQARIRAPSNATVLDVIVHPGETVNPNAPLIKIADLTKLVAEVEINEADLIKIQRGQNVDITSDAYADRTYKGVVSQIAQQADKARGTVQVKVDLVVPDQSLRPGLSVKCTFLPMQGEKPHMFISRTALTAHGDVFIVGSDRKLSARAVKTGDVQGATVEVLSGLADGDEIVTDASTVHEGQQLPAP